MGALLSDAANARVRADLEALKIAEVYAGHELLKHLPVPRFRMPDLTIEFPVVVSAVTLAKEPTSDNLFTQPTESEVTTTFGRALTRSEIRLSISEEEQLRSAVNDALKRAFVVEGPMAILSSDRVSQQAATAASATFVRMRGEASEEATKLERSVKEAVRQLLLTKLTDTPHVEVRVGSGEIKEHGNTDSILRVRVTISEDAYEVVERAGPSTGYKLIPE
jgi:hypothetical protein